MRGTEVGKAWYEALKNDPSLQVKYSQAGKSYTAQREFRQRWAGTKAEELRYKRTQVQTMTDEVLELAEYESYPRSVVLKGQSPPISYVGATTPPQPTCGLCDVATHIHVYAQQAMAFVFLMERARRAGGRVRLKVRVGDGEGPPGDKSGGACSRGWLTWRNARWPPRTT